jgi:hypothetical protein
MKLRFVPLYCNGYNCMSEIYLLIARQNLQCSQKNACIFNASAIIAAMSFGPIGGGIGQVGISSDHVTGTGFNEAAEHLTQKGNAAENNVNFLYPHSMESADDELKRLRNANDKAIECHSHKFESDAKRDRCLQGKDQSPRS